MEIHEAQQEIRSVYINGSVGQVISGIIWLISVVLATWVSIRSGIIALTIGGMFIFPLTQLALRSLGRPTTLSRENPFDKLAMQVAFIIPLSLPVIGAATLQNVNWFYPAFMVIVGAHYLPFMTLYGMWQYAILASALIGSGVTIGVVGLNSFSIGGWITAAVLFLFAVAARRLPYSDE